MMETTEAGRLFIDEAPEDVVHAVLSLVQQAQVSGRALDDDTCFEIEATIRRTYGCGPTYCQKDTPKQVLEKLVRRDRVRGVSIRTIARTYGIGETTVRRYLLEP